MLAGIGLYGLLDANTKLLSGHFDVWQVLLVRYVVLLLGFLLLWWLRPDIAGPLTTRRPGLQLLRSCLMAVSGVSFYLAFRRLPLAQGYLVFFTAPFLTLALAATLLREAVPRAAWLWCLVGFTGVLLAIAPKLGTGGALAGYIAIFVGTVAFSVIQTINRSLRTERGLAGVILWPSLFGLLLSARPTTLQWVAPEPLQFAALVLNGLLSGAAIACTAAAFRHADAARLGPFGFAALPVSVALDLGIWGVWPDLGTMLGGAVVVGACLMSERARRRARGPVPLGQSMPAGNSWRPSAPSGSGATARTAARGKAP